MKALILIGIIVLFLVGCEVSEDDSDTIVREPSPDDTVAHEPSPDDIVIDEYTGFEGITKQQCIEAGGHWNECGSPCAGTGADFCIEMCQVQCECSGIAGFGCPEGYKCRLSGKIADEMGVCVKG